MLKRKNNPERDAAYALYCTQCEIDAHLDERLRSALEPKRGLCFRVLPDNDGTLMWDNHIETIGELMDAVELFTVAGVIDSLSECDERRARSMLSALRALAFEDRICGLPKEARHLSNPKAVNDCVRRLRIEAEYSAGDVDEDGDDPFDTWLEPDLPEERTENVEEDATGVEIPTWIGD